ncbi:MAG: hypothetical protein EB051_04275 [Chlamydiia bacterium]|nr:hypothetical protein [Chlamydiia bacterium]
MPLTVEVTRTTNYIQREIIAANMYETLLSGVCLYAVHNLVDKGNNAAPTYLMGTFCLHQCINLISSIGAYALLDKSDLSPREMENAQKEIQKSEPSGADTASDREGDTFRMLPASSQESRESRRSSSATSPQARIALEGQGQNDRLLHQGLLTRYNRMYSNFYRKGVLPLLTGIGIGIFANEENKNSFCQFFSKEAGR